MTDPYQVLGVDPSASDAEVMPFPRELTTPPVMNTYLTCFLIPFSNSSLFTLHH